MEGSTKVSVFKDTIDPHILSIGFTPSDEEDSSGLILHDFTIVVIETNMQSIVYSLDEGINIFNSSQFSKDLCWTRNESYRFSGTINREAWEKTTLTNITIRFYARDITGNTVYRDIVFDKGKFTREEDDVEVEK